MQASVTPPVTSIYFCSNCCCLLLCNKCICCFLSHFYSDFYKTMFTKDYILLNFILLPTFYKTASCSLLSRLKNPARYQPTDQIILLPQDYYVDNITGDFASTSAESEPHNWTNLQTRKVSRFNMETYKRRPVKDIIEYKHTTIANQNKSGMVYVPERRIKVLEARPTKTIMPNITIYTYTPSITTEEIIPSSTRITWKPYFRYTPAFRHHNQYLPFTEPSYEINTHSTSALLPGKYIVGKFRPKDFQTRIQTGKVINVTFRPKDFRKQYRPVAEGKPAFRASKGRKNKRFKLRCFYCGMNLRGLSNSDCGEFFGPAYRPKKTSITKRCDTRRVKTNGCFKRFLDVENYYVERGCRYWPPDMGKSYASKRLARVEKMLIGIGSGCTFSPMASLTPFSKGVSLYVRYHACVCLGRYCNSANQHTAHLFIWMMYLCISTLLINKSRQC